VAEKKLHYHRLHFTGGSMTLISAAMAAGAGIFIIFYIAVIVLLISAGWQVFVKAGQPGWGVIIPIYNIYLICKIAGRPGWWVILYFIPIVNVFVALVVSLDVAKAFAKGTGFGIGLWILYVIFIPILGFGPAQYVGPQGVARV
jgi:hypothetical protein